MSETSQTSLVIWDMGDKFPRWQVASVVACRRGVMYIEHDCHQMVIVFLFADAL